MALVVGLDPLAPPLMRSFILTDQEKTAAAGMADIGLPCGAQADALADAYRRSVMALAARIVATS